MTGNQIKNMLADMRLVLCNSANDMTADYHISRRGVPYVSVILEGKRYTFIYFGKTKIFRVFDDQQNKKDFSHRNDVIQYFRDLKGCESYPYKYTHHTQL